MVLQQVADKAALNDASVSPRRGMTRQDTARTPQSFLPGVSCVDNVPLQLDQWTMAQLMPEQAQLDTEYAFEYVTARREDANNTRSWEAIMLGMGL